MRKLLRNEPYKSHDLVLMMLKTSPFYSSVALINVLLNAAIPTLTIFFTAGFIDTALAVFAGTKRMSDIALPVAGLLAVTLYGTLVGFALRIVNARKSIYLRRMLRPMIIERVALLSYRHIENQDTADLINRVAPVFDSKIYSNFDSVFTLVSSALSAVGVIVTVMSQSWWAGLIIVASAVPLMFIAKKAGEQSYEAERETTKITRRAAYLAGVLHSRDAVEERTVYGYTDALNKQFLERYETARKIRLRVSFRNFVKQKAGGVVGSVIAVATILSMIPSALNGGIEYGMFIALMGGIINLVRSLSWGVNSQVVDIAKNREYLRDLTKFMALSVEPDATALPKPGMSFNKIEFRDVRFTYPGTDKVVLDGVTFIIENGRHYSFVGVNGAGKTTITKLLTGLYREYEGEILVDGRSLREFTQPELKGLCSVVYQDFARYAFTLYENVAVGSPDATERQVADAITLAGLDDAVAKLPNGVQTYLGKIYEGGMDLSGGEWQRVAIARSLVSGAPLRILDEPTAALDPVGESLVYSQFEEISRGKTTVFISHRLGSTKLADTIFVLADGKIAESGSHAELMRLDGLYAEMYNAQAEWYSDKVVEATHAEG